MIDLTEAELTYLQAVDAALTADTPDQMDQQLLAAVRELGR